MVAPAQSALCVESMKGTVGVGEGEHLLLEDVNLTKSKHTYLSSRSTEQWERGWRVHNSTLESVKNRRRLPQTLEPPIANLCAEVHELQCLQQEPETKQLLTFITFLLFFICWLWTVIQKLHCWMQGWGRREFSRSMVISRLCCSKDAALLCSYQSLSVGLNYSQKFNLSQKMASGKLDRSWIRGENRETVNKSNIQQCLIDSFCYIKPSGKEEW